VPYRSLEGSVNMNFLKRADAVSPVIGVILMVAITVILAAVIAAFVFGMASGVSKTKNIAVTAKKVGTTIMVTYDGGPDDSTVVNLNATFDNNGTNFATVGTAFQLGGVATKPAVGQSFTTSGDNGGTAWVNVPTHTVITGWFNDGTSQVVLDTYV